MLVFVLPELLVAALMDTNLLTLLVLLDHQCHVQTVEFGMEHNVSYQVKEHAQQIITLTDLNAQ